MQLGLLSRQLSGSFTHTHTPRHREPFLPAFPWLPLTSLCSVLQPQLPHWGGSQHRDQSPGRGEKMNSRECLSSEGVKTDTLSSW